MNEAERLELAERLRYDTPFWAGGVSEGRPPGPNDWHGAAKVVSKARQIVPLVAHPWQLEYDAALEAQRAQGLPMRAIILKARQLGFSTWTAAKFLQRCTQIPYTSAVVVAQDVRTANHILKMAKLMYAHLPEEHELGLGFSIKPSIIGQSESENGRAHIQFGERSRRLREQGRTWSSMFEIDTANTPDAGRGTTKNLVHLSEVAQWQKTEKMEGLLNAVPYLEETIVVLESTARGLNHFHKRWVAAEQGAQDPLTGETYTPIFVPWWRDDRAAMPFSTPDQRERFVESIGDTRRYGETVEAEPALVELYGTTPEQLAWRRMQIRTQHKGHVALFGQENPASPEEAFISSGRPFFSQILVSKAIKAAEAAPEPVEGTLRASGFRERRTRAGTIKVPTGALWVPASEARPDEPRLQVWEHPHTAESLADIPRDIPRPPVGAYVVGVDVAEGAADTFEEGDFHAIQVFDHRTRMQVAQHESRMDRHLMPLWVLLVALYYNEAWLAVEVNSVGVAVQDPIAKDYRYSRNYRRRRANTLGKDTGRLVGWKTSPETKPIAEDAMGTALEGDTRGGLRSMRAVRQFTTYVQDEKGRRGAMPGEHDDLLMAAMIAQAVMEEYRPPREKGSRSVRGRTVNDEITGY